MKNDFYEVENMQDFLARISGEDRQILTEHLNNVANISSVFSNYKGVSYFAGILHDFGKATFNFQDYLIKGGERGSVVHALQGAFFAHDSTCNSKDNASILFTEIAALTIAAHHGFLADGISPDGQKVFYEKLDQKENEKYNYHEVKQNIGRISSSFTSNTVDLLKNANKDINLMLGQIFKTYTSKNSADFALGLFVKYIYSCLIDADRLDAYLFDVNEQFDLAITDWNSLIKTFEKNLQKLSGESEIAQIRQSVSDRCKEASVKATGIYQLCVPTGGGKTLSSLRFALHHCENLKKKRIIYVIPYLSIIEQTAATLRSILNLEDNDDTLLECHSSIVMPDNEEEQKIRMLAASRWDKPIIVTTMVQFLESVFSSKGSDLRKFHNMSDSVIIFDEIQSLPIKTIHLFNEAVSFLAKLCNTTILLCTATQPLLDKTERKNLLLEADPNLIDCNELFDNLQRTRIVAEKERDVDDFAAFVSEKTDEFGNCLAIVNTKKSAYDIYNCLKDSDCNAVYHLSTYMCSAHRAVTLTNIREALKQNKKIICISTQLIEAGVDISFSCVVRASAGLDSVAQAAGRCNRNGESKDARAVYVIPLKDENLDKLVDVKVGKTITQRLIRENKGADLLDSVILDKFYRHYFHDRKNLMDYPTKTNQTIYEMLSYNETGRGNYKNRTGYDCNCFVAQAFHTADENFCVIDKNTESVVVRYGKAEAIIDAYQRQPKDRITREKIDCIRKLEKLSVSLYSWELEKLASSISLLDEETGIKILDKKQYADDVGVILEIDPLSYII